MISWSTALGATYRSASVSFSEKAIGLAYPLSDIVVLIIVLVLISHRRAESRPTFGLVASGFAALALSDSAFSYLTTTKVYATGALLDLGWVLAFALIGLASVRRYGSEEERSSEGNQPLTAGASMIPLALALLAASIIITSAVLGFEDATLVVAGAVTLALLVARQVLAVVDQARLQSRLIYQATHDLLTELPNRALFREHLDKALRERRQDRSSIAMVFADLDDFKAINDVMGHAAGDELLRHVAKRFQASLREGDVIARTGGDEFAALLVGVTPEEVVATGGRMLESLSAPFSLPERPVSITASVGAAVHPGGDTTVEQLTANADIAMYAAKKAGKGTLKLFEPSMLTQVKERADLLEDLRRGIERDEFQLYYQPIISLRSDEIVGVEALLRWYHPTLGLRTPSSFIAVAEESGLIVPIGSVALHAAMADAVRWQRAGGSDKPLFVNVNVSARQLQSSDFVDEVRAAIERTGLDPHQLVLEITETVLVAEASVVAAKLSNLRQLGVRIAIDDFGSGYSSLRYLTQLPIDMIKIDRSFVQLLDRQTEDGHLTLAICKIARTLGFEVVGEGIETMKQLHRLRGMDCDYGQGYEIAPPLPADQLEMFLASERGSVPA